MYFFFGLQPRATEWLQSARKAKRTYEPECTTFGRGLEAFRFRKRALKVENLFPCCGNSPHSIVGFLFLSSIPPRSCVLPPLLPHSNHTPNITHPTSHTQHHTTDITHSRSHTQHHILNITLNITHPTSHTQNHTLNITHSTSQFFLICRRQCENCHSI